MPAGDINRMSAERRRRLVRTAAEEFAAAGYEQASLNRIITRCGLSKSSFYHVIASKRDLFDFVVRDLSRELAGSIGDVTPESFAGPTFWNTIENLFGRMEKTSFREDSFMALGRMFYLSGVPDDTGNAVAETLATVQEWLRQVLLVGRESGAVRDDLPLSLQCRLVFAVLRALDEWTIIHGPTLPPDDVAALVRSQFGAIRRLLDADEANAPAPTFSQCDAYEGLQWQTAHRE